MAVLATSLPFEGVAPADGLDLVREAADWGYSACWASEVQGPDAVSQLGSLAVTTDLDLGTGVVPVQTRSPEVLARTALTLSELSGGRFTLGVGASSEVIVERWAGQPFDKPLTHVRETVAALRPMLRGEQSSFEGEYVHVDGFRPRMRPAAPVPLFVGSLNRLSLEQTGAIADGVCLNQLAPTHIAGVLEHVRKGAAEAGRSLALGDGDGEPFPVMVRIFCAVTDEVPAAREIVKATFAPYIATAGYNRFYRSLGYEDEADGVLAASRERDREAMTAAMSDRLVDDIFILGSPETVARRVREYFEHGADIVAVQPLTSGLEPAAETLRAAAGAL